MKASILTWLVPFILGAFLMFIISDTRTPVLLELPSDSQSLTPVADALNAYSCRVAETKQIILGGEEDGFSLTGIEINTPGIFAEYKRNRTGSKDSIDIDRSYDVGGQDSAFLETFELPSNVAHGIIVMRIRLLSSLRNDAVSIGGLHEGHFLSESANFAFSHPNKNPGWILNGEVLQGQLDDLRFRQRFDTNKTALPKKYASILEYVQSSDKPLNVVISDDTMVDVIGFALCIKPERGKGVTFLVDKFDDELVSLSCNAADKGDHCSVYKGDTVCKTQLPVACFADQGYSLSHSLYEDPNGRADSWSAGDVKFTAPMRGDSFSTQEDGHKFCKKTFGSKYRLANIHDGAQVGGFIAYGDAQNVEQVWVDSNLEPYGNCWTMRSDYPEKITRE